MSMVLGVVGSVRHWGNSELLVRQALRGAQAMGASVKAIRLTDLRLKSCTGCMRCAMGGQPCPLDDDMAWLIEAVQAAEGLVLAAPIYFLAPAAVIKLVLDRLLMVMGQVSTPLPTPRPAITIATAGLESWQGVALPFLNALAGAFGYRPVDSLVAVAPGPGEVLLDGELLSRVWEAGCRVGRGELEPGPTLPNVCPICHSDCFRLSGARAVCPICGREATVDWKDGTVQLRFEPVSGSGQRWTPEGLRTHTIEWVQSTGPRYAARRDQIKERRAAFQEMELEWACPEEHGGA